MSNAAGPRAPSYSIGETATRLSIPISTIRWWEKCGLITPSGWQSGRRRYSDDDLRRLAMIQLWQVTAAMSLDEIRTFLAGTTDDDSWRAAVQARINTCDKQLAQLASARATLAHMLTCPSDHPADTCPYLAETIDQYLATGQLSPPTPAVTG